MLIIKKIDLKKIKTARTKQHLTLQDLADSLNLSHRSVYALKERGKRSFRVDELPTLCRVLHLTLDEIYTKE